MCKSIRIVIARMGLLALILVPFCLFAQEEQKLDSAFVVAFPAGTWLSGIDGSINISASSLPLDTIDLEKGIQFKISTQTGIFLKKSYNLGLRLELLSSQTGGQISNIVSEALFVGPVVGKYFPGSGNWAVAPEVAIGYTSSWVEINSTDPDFSSSLRVRSKGVSGQFGMAFLFMFSPQLGFSMNTRLNAGWEKSQKEGKNSGKETENIATYGMNVSFGFRIFLDEFFF